jgi:hypothetical protein
MIVRLTDWLTSTLRLYTYPAPVCLLTISSVSYTQRVRLASLQAGPSAGTITAVFVFTERTTNRLNESTISTPTRFTGGSLGITVSLTIPSEYTWGQVALVETVTLVGAV